MAVPMILVKSSNMSTRGSSSGPFWRDTQFIIITTITLTPLRLYSSEQMFEFSFI